MYVDGLVLRAEVYKAGLTMKELAEKAGIGRSLLSSIANGARCREATARKIADALDIPLDKLASRRKRG